ncbi:MAG: hypothetical protein Q8P18_06690 [Pseudomonadota bacterium]|nr:hypothetical protein [Pseudomonadota bacterium]
MLLFLLACTGASEDTAAIDPCEGAHAVSWVGFADGFFATYCRSCHSAETQDRFGAPVGMDFDTLYQVRTHAAAVRVTALEQGSMPVGGGVYEDDLILLDEWLRCGI